MANAAHLPNKPQYSHSAILSTKLYVLDTVKAHPYTVKFMLLSHYFHALKPPIRSIT